MATEDTENIPPNREKRGAAATASDPGSPAPRKASADIFIDKILSNGMMLSVQPTDLTRDKLLLPVPRMTFEEQEVPSLGGIPLLAKIGQGGMGAVYYGVHRRLNKEVAVKVLPFHLAEQRPDLIDRFLREAQIAAKAVSPNLVAVMDVNQEGGVFFLVMEFVFGETAGHYLKETVGEGLDEGTALEICIAATIGLAAAHAEGIVHRDIKPDNILIPRKKGYGGKPGDFLFKGAKLADLGLARSEEVAQSLTGDHNFLGTAGYMSPEQAMDAKNAGPPADVFSMGATLYALLACKAPFVGSSSMKIMINTMNKPHIPITQIRNDLSAPMIALLERCLKKDAHQRFHNASDLLDALKACRDVMKKPQSAQQRVIQQICGVIKRDADASVDSMVSAGADSVAEDRLTLNTALYVAVEAKKNGDWLEVVAALEEPVRLLGHVVHPNKKLAESLLKEARAELAKHRQYHAAVENGQRLITEQKFEKAKEVFLGAQQVWPDCPDQAALLNGLDFAERSLSQQRYLYDIQAGEQALAARQWVDAEHFFAEALRERPEDPMAYQGLQEARAGAVEAATSMYAQSTYGSIMGESIMGESQLPESGFPRQVLLDLGQTALDLVFVPPGDFQMPDRGTDAPINLTVTKPFYIGKYPITVAQFGAFVAETGYQTDAEREGKGGAVVGGKLSYYAGVSWRNPGFTQQDDHPVVVVSWNDARAFAQWAGWKTSSPIRLPTEGEWEYGSNGSEPEKMQHRDSLPPDTTVPERRDAMMDTRVTVLPFSPGSMHFHIDSTEVFTTFPVGVYPNASWCGAFDMTGNVWQWCEDWLSESVLASDGEVQDSHSARFKIIRGSTWHRDLDICFAARRSWCMPVNRFAYLGFRVVMDISV